MARLRNIQTIAQNAAQGAARAMGFGGQPAASATTPWWAQARQQQAQVVQEPDIFPESGVTNNHVPTLLQPGTKADAIPADVIADTAALAQAVLGANKVLTEVLYKLRADLEATADIQNTMVEVVGETDNDGLRAQVAAPAGPTLDEINSAVNAAFVPMVQRNQQLEAVIRALAEKLGLSVDQFLGAGQQGVVQTPPAAATVPILVAVAGTPTLVPAGGTPAASTGSSFMDAFRKGRQATASKP